MRPAGWLAEAFLLALLPTGAAIAASAAPLAAAASTPQAGARWGAVERRIESGYFQQDAAALESLAAALARPDEAPPGDAKTDEWRSYYGALIAYRLALLAKDDQSRAWPYTQRCVGDLDHALVLDTGSAEALALQSACLALQSRFDAWRSPFAAPRSRSRIEKALRLAPRNPRVLLLGARAACDRPQLFGGDSQLGFALLQRAVLGFERQRTPAAGLPAWGAADAFVDLAQDYLTRGDTIAARNVLERALLVAPHFAAARRLMAQIVAG